MKHTQAFILIAAESKVRIHEITIEALLAKRDRNESFHLVDVREESEWKEGHLPGAIHIGRGVLERDIESKVTNMNAEVILYCRGGFRSAMAADNLQKMGFTNVYSLDTGWRGWIAKKLPTE